MKRNPIDNILENKLAYDFFDGVDWNYYIEIIQYQRKELLKRMDKEEIFEGLMGVIKECNGVRDELTRHYVGDIRRTDKGRCTN